MSAFRPTTEEHKQIKLLCFNSTHTTECTPHNTTNKTKHHNTPARRHSKQHRSPHKRQEGSRDPGGYLHATTHSRRVSLNCSGPLNFQFFKDSLSVLPSTPLGRICRIFDFQIFRFSDFRFITASPAFLSNRPKLDVRSFIRSIRIIIFLN